MKYLVFRTNDGRFDLVEMPTERMLAAGSFESVVAAARLLGLDWTPASPWSTSLREIRKQEDARVFEDA